VDRVRNIPHPAAAWSPEWLRRLRVLSSQGVDVRATGVRVVDVRSLASAVKRRRS
jgi:hypothetical protein